MKQLFTDFMYFSQGMNPIGRNINAVISIKLLFVGKTLLLMFLFKVIIAFVNILLSKYGLIEATKSGSDLPSWLSETSSINFILQVVILAPLLEEVAFRGILQHDQLTVSAAFGVLCYLLLCVMNNINFYSFSSRTIFVIIISVLVGIIFQKIAVHYLISITSNYSTSRYIIWLSACGFAFWHYNNYDFTVARPHTILFSLLPHFVSGLIFSWMSLTYGLKWSIILHVLNNAIPVLTTLWRASHETKIT